MRPGGWGHDGISTLRGRGEPAHPAPGHREKEGASAGRDVALTGGQTGGHPALGLLASRTGRDTVLLCKAPSGVWRQHKQTEMVCDSQVHRSTWLG